MKKTMYRVKEVENKAGGKRFYAQHRVSIFGLFSVWLGIYYYNEQLYDDIFAGDSYYTNYCDAINCIKYHRVFHNEKNKVIIHQIND